MMAMLRMERDICGAKRGKASSVACIDDRIRTFGLLSWSFTVLFGGFAPLSVIILPWPRLRSPVSFHQIDSWHAWTGTSLCGDGSRKLVADESAIGVLTHVI